MSDRHARIIMMMMMDYKVVYLNILSFV